MNKKYTAQTFSTKIVNQIYSVHESSLATSDEEPPPLWWSDQAFSPASKLNFFNYIRSLKIEVISDISQIYKLWQEFSHYESLFDTWEFRYSFYQGYDYKPYFLVIKDKDSVQAVLPLWYDPEKKKYVWFGSSWHEDNKFFVSHPIFIPLLLAAAPYQLDLFLIDKQVPRWIVDIMRFDLDDPKFILDLTKYHSVDQVLAQLTKKHRYNLRRDKRKFDQLQTKIKVNQLNDFNLMIDLIKKRFNKRGEDCDWNDIRRVNTFKHVLRFGQQEKYFSNRMISLLINNEIVAVDFNVIYKDCYYVLSGGSKLDQYPGVGNYMNMIDVQDAIDLGMKKIDFLENDYNWKAKWLEPVVSYKFCK